ncbi:MAG TPA: hypothetical protein VFF73_34440 [Planctomycetota bacterium]|nr:hypothetical protein [Planctomycetota bacterium]
MSTVHEVRLPSPIPPALLGDVRGKLAYVAEDVTSCEVSPQLDRITFRLKETPSLAADVVSQRILTIVGKMCGSYRGDAACTIVSHLDRSVPFRDDPHGPLASAGEILEYGPGRFGLGPLPLRLIELFESRFRELARTFDARPHQFPALIGARTLERCQYLRSFPHALTLVTHLREDLDAIQAFARDAAWADGGLRCDWSHLSPFQVLLSSAVCFHWYAWLADSRQPTPRAITATGKCFRYEASNMGGLERLWDFTMREIVFAGPAQHVLDARERAIVGARRLLDEWGLAYEISSATDPFFIDNFAQQTTIQSAFALKFEVRALLPYKAPATLAVASFNYHQNLFGRAFEIRDGGGAPIHTSCVGFGLERMAFAFLAQFGLDPDRWPEAVREGVDAR